MNPIQDRYTGVLCDDLICCELPLIKLKIQDNALIYQTICENPSITHKNLQIQQVRRTRNIKLLSVGVDFFQYN